jgi:hypothetical protein
MVGRYFPHARLRVLLIFLTVLVLLPVTPLAAQSGGAAVRIAARPISGATAQSPLPDPALLPAGDSAARDLVENLFVGLFRYDSGTRTAVPVLAREWTVSDDGLTWTFILREDIQWVGHNPGHGHDRGAASGRGGGCRGGDAAGLPSAGADPGHPGDLHDSGLPDRFPAGSAVRHG